jgi:hypothetical protein
MVEERSMSSRAMRANAVTICTGSGSARAARTAGRSAKAMGWSSPPREVSRTAVSMARLEPNSRYTVGSGTSAAPATASMVAAG